MLKKAILKVIPLCIISSVSFVALAQQPSALPDACVAHCAAPYGSKIGTNNGVDSFSNCNSSCINVPKENLSNFNQKMDPLKNTGIKWQCVEYARRWLITNKGMTFDSIDSASDIWAKTYALEVKDGQKLNFLSLENGGTQAPQMGDLLIYKKSQSLPYGHVAVVVGVDLAKGFVDVAEENYENKVWDDATHYARRIKLMKDNNKYLISDNRASDKIHKDDFSLIYGWKRVEFKK